MYREIWDEFGVIIHPLQSEKLKEHIENWCNYMKLIMLIPQEFDLSSFKPFELLNKSDEEENIKYKYRFEEKNDENIHIPQTHGITQYGSQNMEAINLLNEFEPIVYCVFDAIFAISFLNKKLTVENGYIFVQCY
jgi:hypothetical protein